MSDNALRSGIYAIIDLDRLAPVLPQDPNEELGRVLAYGRAAAESGAVALQLRAKSASPHSIHLRRLYAGLLDAFGARLPVIMNDALEVVEPFAARPGCGLHLGQGDLSPVTARHRLGETAMVGWSTHNLDQVAMAGGLDLAYIGFGPVRPTGSKQGADPAVGLDGLQAAFLHSQHPIVAIGGLGHADIEAVRSAGASAMAVISGWLGPADAPHAPEQAERAIAAMAARWTEVAGG